MPQGAPEAWFTHHIPMDHQAFTVEENRLSRVMLYSQILNMQGKTDVRKNVFVYLQCQPAMEAPALKSTANLPSGSRYAWELASKPVLS